LCVRSRSLLPIVARLSRPYKALSMLCLTGSSSHYQVELTVHYIQFCRSTRSVDLLTQSCSLRSVTLAPTYRRSLISPLQSIINALLNGQLVALPS
ncbi:MAG: hypothetical protein J6A63_10430, partial [Clostridia bacterium]|nr:hypothetical protein [Clostridia bacterium]